MNLPSGVVSDTQTGKPPPAMNEQYQHLLALREVYPEKSNHVLNIHGISVERRWIGSSMFLRKPFRYHRWWQSASHHEEKD